MQSRPSIFILSGGEDCSQLAEEDAKLMMRAVALFIAVIASIASANVPSANDNCPATQAKVIEFKPKGVRTAVPTLNRSTGIPVPVLGPCSRPGDTVENHQPNGDDLKQVVSQEGSEAAS